MAFLRGTSFDDTEVRNAVKDFFQNKFNVLLNETPQEMKVIDLTGVTETLLGVEVERGGWSNSFWDNEKYSSISELGFKTINIPIRKEKYWLKEYFFYGKLKQNPSHEKNIFVRTNKNFTQIILIRPETVKDKTKVIKTSFTPNNSNELEEWMCFKKEDVETYNLINGSWILEKHEI